MVHMRAQKTRLDCYYEFTKKYENALKKTSTGLENRLSEAVSPMKRLEAIESIAWMSQLIKCDEQYRASHRNESTDCPKAGHFEDKFSGLYSKLKSQAYWANLVTVSTNKVIEMMIINVSILLIG